jgi:hypothetical protein
LAQRAVPLSFLAFGCEFAFLLFEQKEVDDSDILQERRQRYGLTLRTGNLSELLIECRVHLRSRPLRQIHTRTGLIAVRQDTERVSGLVRAVRVWQGRTGGRGLGAVQCESAYGFVFSERIDQFLFADDSVFVAVNAPEDLHQRI